MRLLLADDDEISRNILEETLVSLGYEVEVADDGNQASEILEATDPPRLVILDWMMPGLKGPEVCQKLRMKAHSAYTYVILLTSRKEREDIVHGLSAGADDYLIKPFNPKELEARLNCGKRILSLESALMDSLRKLELSERNKQEFISALTHDLRTPLLAEKRALELINKYEDEVSTRVLGLFKAMVINNQEELKLVNSLLDSFHSEAVELKLHKEKVNIHTVVAECLMSLQTLADTKSITLKNNINRNLPLLSADISHLKRIIINLVGNAISNISEGSIIQAECEEDDTGFQVSIKDNGPGISVELLPYLFERYHASINATQKIGSGLGLSICKTLVELHGGKISVTSTINRGTNFLFTLPKNSTSLLCAKEENYISH